MIILKKNLNVNCLKMENKKYNLFEEISGDSGNYIIKSGNPREFYNLLGEYFSPEQGNTSYETNTRIVFVESVPVCMKSDWNHVIITRNREKIKKILEEKIKGFTLERELNKVPSKLGKRHL